MDGHAFLTGAEQVAGHDADSLVTDPAGHLISDVQLAPDGTATFTDGQGMYAGTIHADVHGQHIDDAAGQQLFRVDSNTVYNATNVPIAQILQHGNVTDISDLSGKPLGHLLRTNDGVLTFNGDYPPHEVGTTTRI